MSLSQFIYDAPNQNDLVLGLNKCLPQCGKGSLSSKGKKKSWLAIKIFSSGDLCFFVLDLLFWFCRLLVFMIYLCWLFFILILHLDFLIILLWIFISYICWDCQTYCWGCLQNGGKWSSKSIKFLDKSLVKIGKSEKNLYIMY